MRLVPWLALALSLIPMLSCDGSSSAGPLATARPRIEVVALAPVASPVFTTVRPGDTVEAVCRRLAGDDWMAWRDALVTVLDPRRLQLGISFDGRLAGNRLRSLQVVLDIRRQLLLERTGEEIHTETVELPVELRPLRLSGTIDSSLFAAIEQAGGRPELAVRLAEVFQWDIDFLRDLRQGDSFVAVADEQLVDGQHYGYGIIYGVSFTNRGRQLVGIAFRDQSGRLGYFDAEGRPMRKQFLRSPLKFSRITSRFSLHRFHPIHKRRMPHYGVDYGAPVGTPVRATGDGTVTAAGRSGGAGRMVSVRHANGFETCYLHLSKYGHGIRRGARVSQGQVVGYVGSSGLSTGPHLDYRVKHNGRWINPLTISSPPVQPLDEAHQQRFLAYSEQVKQLLGERQLVAVAALRAHLQDGSDAGEVS